MPARRKPHFLFETFKVAAEHHDPKMALDTLVALVPDTDVRRIVDSLGFWYPEDAEVESQGDEGDPESGTVAAGDESFSDTLRREFNERRSARFAGVPES